MADDGFDGLPYRDTLKVPSVLVLPGDPWPADFYSRYPEAFRVPVQVVRRNEASAQHDATPAPRPSSPATDRRSDVTADSQPVTGQGKPGGAAVSDPVSVGGANYLRPDPIGTFLLINRTLDRLTGTTQQQAQSTVQRGFPLRQTPS